MNRGMMIGGARRRPRRWQAVITVQNGTWHLVNCPSVEYPSVARTLIPAAPGINHKPQFGMSGYRDNSSVTSSFLRDEEVADRIRCTVLQRNKYEKSRSADSFPYGMVIDDGCCLPWLEMVQSTRIALPLNSKRPTVDRRFLCDTNREIVSVIESMVLRGLERAGFDINEFNVYCNKYVRILEYNRKGSELLPHSDGTKICDDTGHKSSHTLLMFLSYCENGGETILMDGKCDWSKQSNLSVSDKRRFRHGKEGDIFHDIVDADETHVSVGIQPIVGRIFLFPHDWPHAGGVCESTPKIALRAELTVLRKHGNI